MKILIEANAYLVFYEVLITNFVLKEFGSKQFFAQRITGRKNWDLKGKDKNKFRAEELFDVTNDHTLFYRWQRAALKAIGNTFAVENEPLTQALEYVEAKGVPTPKRKYRVYPIEQTELLWKNFTKKYSKIISKSTKSILETPLVGNFSGQIKQGSCTDECEIRFYQENIVELGGFMKVWYEPDHPDTPETAEFILSKNFYTENDFSFSYFNRDASKKQYGTLILTSDDGLNTLTGRFQGYFEKEIPPKRRVNNSQFPEGSVILHRQEKLSRLDKITFEK